MKNFKFTGTNLYVFSAILFSVGAVILSKSFGLGLIVLGIFTLFGFVMKAEG